MTVPKTGSNDRPCPLPQRRRWHSTALSAKGDRCWYETDGWCTDLTIEFTPTVGGDYYVHVSARGSDFPKNGPTDPPRYPFKGVWGTLTVERIS